ncbi:MAG: PilN domain-containing protein [Proteobacteria bacterium]|nr:PilN domain-containing protein [Pseudomonadota bacterium]
MPVPDYLTAARRAGADAVRRAGLAGFGRWWQDELAAGAPAWLRNALERRRLRPVLAIDGERVAFWRPVVDADGVRLAQQGTLDAVPDADAVASEGRAHVAALFAPGARPGVTLALPPARVLRRTLTLPAAVADNLRATVGYDLDRLTPFKAEDVYYDAVVASRDSVRGTIVADIAVARRRVVDHAIAIARTFGADPLAVVPAAPADAAAVALDLMPNVDHDERRRWGRWEVLVPLALVVVLAATALIVPVWQKRAEAIAVMRAADAEAIRAKQSDALREALARMTAQYNFTLQRKHAYPAVGVVLEEISSLLPDDTWLTQFEFKTTTRGTTQQRDVSLRGESANAGKLVSLLEAARTVGDATPRSPTTKLQPGPGESFDLGLKVKEQPLPAMVALADATPIREEPPPAPPAPAVTQAKAAAPAAPAATAAAPAADAEADGEMQDDAAAGDGAEAMPPPAPKAARGATPGHPRTVPGLPGTPAAAGAAQGSAPAKAPAHKGFGPLPRQRQ